MAPKRKEKKRSGEDRYLDLLSGAFDKLGPSKIYFWFKRRKPIWPNRR